MKTSRMKALAVTSLLVTPGLLPVAFSQRISRQRVTAGSMSEMPELLAAPLFIEANGFTSRITMVSELNFAVTAEVILFDPSGSPIASRSVAFSPHSQQVLQVADLLRQANSAATFGAVQIRPDPGKVVSMAIAAQLSISGSGAMLGQHIEEEFLMLGGQKPGILRAAGASLLAQPVIALYNAGSAAQTAALSCIAEKGAATEQKVQLTPGGSVVVQGCAGSSTHPVDFISDLLSPPAAGSGGLGAFGMSVTGSGKPGTLSAFSFSWRGTVNGPFISSHNFVDAAAAQSANTVFTGVPVGESRYLPGSVFEPQVALTNFGSKPAHATVLVAHTDESTSSTKPAAVVTVPARAALTVSLPPLQGDLELRNSFIIQADAAAGALAVNLVSIGSSGFDLVEQIGKDQQAAENGGGHPWDISGDKDAVLLLFNHSPKPKYFNVKIGNGGVLWQQAWLLQSMETRSVSIKTLIADKVADLKGAKLPEGLTQGEISWFTPNPAEGKGRLMQVDPSPRTVAGNPGLTRNFSCGYNLVLCGAYLQNELLGLAYASASDPLYLGDVIPDICDAWSPTDCSGNSYGSGGSGYNYYWQANTPSVSTVSGSNTNLYAYFYGNGTGSGSATGFVHSQYCNYGGGGTTDVCKVTINSVNLYSDEISTTLSGPSGATGSASVWEAASNADNYSVETVTRGSATFKDKFNLTASSPLKQYTTVYADWNACPNVNITSSVTHNFYNWGNTYHTQYAVIWENTCTAGTSTAYIITNLSACYSSGLITDTLSTQFEGQVVINGTGQSNSYGLVQTVGVTSCAKATTGKPAGANNSNTFVEVSSFKGQCGATLSDSDVAQYSSPGPPVHRVNCSQEEFLRGYPSNPGTLKTVQDRCPACSNTAGSAHFDNFNSSQGAPSCGLGSIPSLGNFVTVTDGTLPLQP